MPQEPPPVPASNGGDGLRRLRATVAYDGTAYHGWAAQPGLPTVEDTLRRALGRVLRWDGVRLTCAGRTDAGVHATGQVVHVDAPADADPAALTRSCNAVLPLDIRVRDMAVAPSGFDARFSALWRRYRYRVSDGVADPLTRHMVLAVGRRLDLEAMQSAVEPLLGLHDFGSFCKPRAGATALRTLLECHWRRESRDLVVLEVRADAFCHSMVRSIVGASLEVGLGRRPGPYLGELLAAPSRQRAAPVAPAHGLVLQEVGYPDEDLLAVRAEQARSMRVAAGPDRRG